MYLIFFAPVGGKKKSSVDMYPHLTQKKSVGKNPHLTFQNPEGRPPSQRMDLKLDSSSPSHAYPSSIRVSRLSQNLTSTLALMLSL